MVWIKNFPHLKHCKLLHTTHGHFGVDTTQATVIILNSLLQAEKQETKWSSSLLIMILPDDLDRVQTAHFHVQRCPWLFSVLCLWFCSVDPFSCAQFVGYKTISMPTKSGCFLFKWEILHEMPRLSFCLTLAHWSLQIFSFTQELQGESTLLYFFIFGITSKGAHSPHHSLWETAGLFLHMFRPSHFYHHFACTSHFVLNSPALLHNSKADNFWDPNSHAEEKIYYISESW